LWAMALGYMFALAVAAWPLRDAGRCIKAVAFPAQLMWM
jgi:hypothetical protein